MNKSSIVWLLTRIGGLVAAIYGACRLMGALGIAATIGCMDVGTAVKTQMLLNGAALFSLLGIGELLLGAYLLFRGRYVHDLLMKE